MRTKVTNRSFDRIAGIGTINPDNRIAPPITPSKKISVVVEQTSSHAPIVVQILVPVKRSTRGSRRVTSLSLTGTQARELYKTLNKVFADGRQVDFNYDMGDGLE